MKTYHDSEGPNFECGLSLNRADLIINDKVRSGGFTRLGFSFFHFSPYSQAGQA
jgi:hypothetical protein